MAEITAKMVAELRARTGLGMMECKKALVEAHGDMKAAEELLRIKSGNKAGKVAGRTAAEGIVASFINDAGKVGAIVEVNSETDFVAKDTSFIAFAEAVAEAIAKNNPDTLEEVATTALASGESIEEARKALIAKLGENIGVRRFTRFETADQLAVYIHNNRIGVLVDLNGDVTLGKDIAMHVAASKPLCVSKDEVAAEVLETERRVYTAQAAESGKPADIVEKMVEGRINKFLAEMTLLGQPFVKNPDQTVEQLLKEKNAKVNAFSLLVVGEGIEKEEVDYAAEVAAAAKVN
jgi:elongation factor Ts